MSSKEKHLSSCVRTRFAPSPTGFLHVGGARTALFSWLYARRHQGQFILRIEDTDLERSTDASIEAILQGLAWLNIDWDEGPFYQTKRFDRYKEVLEELLKKGDAYRCYCSKERLEKLRETQMANKEKPRYDGLCRDLTEIKDAPYVVRFKNPQTGDVVFNDLIRGPISVSNSELDDLILARTDGVPTYNFTVAVDDWEMKITQVIRGDDHINNTPRQINILKALGAPIPNYAHVPMILGDDGKRLSKRHGAVSVMQYKEDGVLPEALLNYLVRLGWSHGDQEIFSVDEMKTLFDLDHVSRSAAAFNTEKLLWLNQHYLKTENPEKIAVPFAEQLLALNLDPKNGPSLSDVINALKERANTLREMAQMSRYFYSDEINYDAAAVSKHLLAETKEPLLFAVEQFKNCEWNKEALHDVILQTAEKFNLKMGKIAQPIRIAVTGNTMSPSIDVTLLLIGRERVVARILTAVKLISDL